MSTSKRKTYHHGNLRQALLELAREKIEKDGPESLSLRALAQEAGVSTMAPYRHFPDHDALKANLASMGFAELRESMVRFDSSDPRKALPGFAVAYVTYALKHPGMFHLMYGSDVPTGPSGQEEDESTVLGLVSSRIAQLVPEEKLDEARLAGWSIIHGFAMLIVQRRIRTSPRNVTAIASRLIEVVMDGLLQGTAPYPVPPQN